MIGMYANNTCPLCQKEIGMFDLMPHLAEFHNDQYQDAVATNGRIDEMRAEAARRIEQIQREASSRISFIEMEVSRKAQQELNDFAERTGLGNTGEE